MTTPPAADPDPAPALELGPVRRPKPPVPAEPTVQLAVPVDPRQTVQLAGAPVGSGATVQLRVDPAAVAETLTVRLNSSEAATSTVRLGPPPAGSTVQLQLPPEAAAFESATFLDPEAWPSPAAPDRTLPEPGRPAAEPTPPDGLRRFGPGVPPQAAAVWHGTAQPAPRRRRWGWWLIVPILLLLVALLGYLGWQRYGGPLVVNSVTAQADPAPLRCDGTQAIKATLLTDGGGGNLTYRWLRSDGTDSGELTQRVPRGKQSTELVLRWSFHGQGSMDATATLEILAPDSHTSAVSFTYECA